MLSFIKRTEKYAKKCYNTKTMSMTLFVWLFYYYDYYCMYKVKHLWGVCTLQIIFCLFLFVNSYLYCVNKACFELLYIVLYTFSYRNNICLFYFRQAVKLASQENADFDNIHVYVAQDCTGKYFKYILWLNV